MQQHSKWMKLLLYHFYDIKKNVTSKRREKSKRNSSQTWRIFICHNEWRKWKYFYETGNCEIGKKEKTIFNSILWFCFALFTIIYPLEKGKGLKNIKCLLFSARFLKQSAEVFLFSFSRKSFLKRSGTEDERFNVSCIFLSF